MQFPHDTAIVVTDGQKLRLLRNTGDEQTLTLAEMPPPDVRGTAGAGQHQDSDRHEVSFEAAVARWLNHQMTTGAIGKVFIVAPPRAMGELRSHYGKMLKEGLVGELTKEHTQDSVKALALALEKS